MSDRFTIFAGETEPSLKEQILVSGESVVFSGGDTAKLRGRLSGAPTDDLLIDAAAVIEDPALGYVRYDWATGDTAAPGLLIAWWYLTISGNAQSTPAFVIPIIDQALVDPGVGVYASVLDVKALAGFLSDAWTPVSTTSDGDLATFLSMTSGEIDAILLSLGAALPLDPASTPAIALRSLTADGALVRALGATWPTNPPAGVMELRNDARSRYTAGLAELASGTHAAALALAQATPSDVGGSLATDDPGYHMYGQWEPLDWNRSLAPGVRKGESL